MTSLLRFATVTENTIDATVIMMLYSGPQSVVLDC